MAKKPKPRKPYLRNYRNVDVSWVSWPMEAVDGVMIDRRRDPPELNAKECRDLGKRLIQAADYLESRKR